MKKELWLRLKHYHFDNLVPPHLSDRVSSRFGGTDPSTHAFASKLARKLDWKPRFALQAIGEYKKFVLLGVTSDFAVTPSKVIDQVWHEHILFSRAYREFCRDVLERDFDHNPELVASDQQTDTFKAQFDATIAAYEREFGVPPPSEVWGTPKFRKDDKTKRRSHADGTLTSASTTDDSTPLYMQFDAGGGDSSSMAEFGGGGGFFGGGGGDSWVSDSSSSDSGSSSSCSSSCGGGGCSS